jgi:hypothetical protein
MIRQNGLLRLERRLPRTHHVLGHGAFGDFVVQQGQLGLNPRRAPGRILQRHATNQVADFTWYGWTARFAGARLSFPVQLESQAIPADDGFWLHDSQGGPPVGPEPGNPHPEYAVAWPQGRLSSAVNTATCYRIATFCAATSALAFSIAKRKENSPVGMLMYCLVRRGIGPFWVRVK